MRKNKATSRHRDFRSYVLSLDYGSRSKELPFIKHLQASFDRKCLVGMALVANNNPYHFELYLYLNFKKRALQFEKWLADNYPEKSRRYNLFIGDFLNAIGPRGYNLVGLGSDDWAELLLSKQENGFFLFPERTIMNERFKSAENTDFSVFLSHSSRDRAVVDRVFEELQKAEVSAWYDKYEIRPGDSITEKINDGLAHCELGLLFLSKSFLDPKAGWTKAEMNYFFHRRMSSDNKRFLCVNVDLPHAAIPPLLQDYRYVSLHKPDAIKQIVESVRQRSISFSE
jgi:hypothetical protein